MGNMENESSFNVESHAMDSNGAMAYGLISWNQASYPNANTLVTGNQSADLEKQVQYLLHDTSNIGAGLTGSTPAEVASNFAANVEVCAGCQPGGTQNTQRVANAQKIAQMAASGNWGSGPGIGAPANLTSSTTCAGVTLFGHCFGISVPNFGADIVDWAERGALIILGGIFIIMGVIKLSRVDESVAAIGKEVASHPVEAAAIA